MDHETALVRIKRRLSQQSEVQDTAAAHVICMLIVPLVRIENVVTMILIVIVVCNLWHSFASCDTAPMLPRILCSIDVYDSIWCLVIYE